MSTYTFSIKNYHAIEDAHITIDGITVLSGENGSGKSTLSRWLYYIVKGTNEYEKYIESDAASDVIGILDKVRRASMIMGIRKAIGYGTYHKMTEEIMSSGSIEAYKDKFATIVDSFIHSLGDYFTHKYSSDDIRRLASLFNINFKDKYATAEIVIEIGEKLYADYNAIVNNTILQKKKRDSESLGHVIAHFASSGDDKVADIQFLEDGVNLLNKKEFKAPLILNRAIYYGTQRTINSLDDYSEFNSLLKTPIGNTPNNARAVEMRMRQIMNGSITYEKSDLVLFNEPELHYHRNDGLNIPLKQAATGLISFACLSRLLENGYLTKDTLLIIDEPEAHLHPQWIVEYARTLILLHKTLGMKILISSHNPDMVSAVQSIAKKEKIINSTHFYLAQHSHNNKMQFVYKDLGTDIGEIFESFNIALSRIQMYGE